MFNKRTQLGKMFSLYFITMTSVKVTIPLQIYLTFVFRCAQLDYHRNDSSAPAPSTLTLCTPRYIGVL